MSWQTGIILTLIGACIVPWLLAELSAVRAMRRRARTRELIERYLKAIDEEGDAWRTK